MSPDGFSEPSSEVIGDLIGAIVNFANQESHIMTWLCYPESYMGPALLRTKGPTNSHSKKGAFINKQN